MDCAAINAEVQANNKKVIELGSVAAGVAGLIIWPLWFAMDFQGAAPKEVAALQARQQYLATLAEQRCGAVTPLPIQNVPPPDATTTTPSVAPAPVVPASSTPPATEPATPPVRELSCINPDGSFLRTTAESCPPPAQPLQL